MHMIISIPNPFRLPTWVNIWRAKLVWNPAGIFWRIIPSLHIYIYIHIWCGKINSSWNIKKFVFRLLLRVHRTMFPVLVGHKYLPEVIHWNYNNFYIWSFFFILRAARLQDLIPTAGLHPADVMDLISWSLGNICIIQNVNWYCNWNVYLRIKSYFWLRSTRKYLTSLKFSIVCPEVWSGRSLKRLTDNRIELWKETGCKINEMGGNEQYRQTLSK